MLAVDVSNYSGPLAADALEAWKAASIGLVIAQAIDPPPSYPSGCTRQQIQACLDAGLLVDAYLYLWFDQDDLAAKLELLDGLPVRRLWLDVEDQSATRYDQATREAAVRAALERCDAFQATSGAPTGIYTGRWFWQGYMGNTSAFADRDLWDARYDGVAEIAAGFESYGGWQACHAKQYAGTSTLAGVGNVDLDVFPEPTLEPCAEIINALGYCGGDLVAALRTEAKRKYGPRRGPILAIADTLERTAREALG